MIDTFIWIGILILTILILLFEIKVNIANPNSQEKENSIMDYVLTGFVVLFALGLIGAIIMMCVINFKFISNV